MANLLANALTASPPGLPVRLDGRAPAAGCGCASSTTVRAYRPTTATGSSPRSSGSTTAAAPASASGLAIARGFTEAMGGALDPSDTPGGGLTMTVTHPGRVMTRILIVDDDEQLLRALRVNLAARGYQVAHRRGRCHRPGRRPAAHPPDLAIVDLGLPDMDGMRVVEGLRGWTTAPIIVLSARHAEAAKVAALDAGADDYVTKPFGMDELLARIRAALRRAAPAPEAPVIATEAFTIDLAAKRVTGPAARSGSPRPSGTCWRSWPGTPTSSSPSANCCTRCGVRSTRRRPTTCGCTWPICAASSNPTRPDPAT